MKYFVEIADASLFENTEYEYKLKLDSSVDRVEKWGKTLVAFSNSFGGHIFVGVSDEGYAVGLERKEIDETKNYVFQTIDRHIFPHISVKFDVIPTDEGKYILSIYVPQSDEMVIYRTGDFNEKVYIREDGASILATVSQILSLGKRKKGADVQILNEQYKQSDYSSYNKLAMIYREDNRKPTNEMLISKEVLYPDGRVTQGLKMFSDNYKDEDTLLVCRLWNGYDKGVDEVIDKKEFSGSLCNIFSGAIEFVSRNSRSGFIKRPDGSRLDTNSYPEIAVREAIVNAIAHRDYSISGTQIDVDIYKDRMEIMSPGSWLLNKKPSEYSFNRIPSVRRNRIICNCFEAIGLMEKSGSGFKKIYYAYKDKDVHEPTLEDEQDFFVITLFDLLADKKEDVTLIFGKYDEEILKFCDGVAHSRSEIQKHVGYKSTPHFITDVLRPMLENGTLIATDKERSKNVKYVARKKVR